jgi:hypothetical protein
MYNDGFWGDGAELPGYLKSGNFLANYMTASFQGRLYTMKLFIKYLVISFLLYKNIICTFNSQRQCVTLSEFKLLGSTFPLCQNRLIFVF